MKKKVILVLIILLACGCDVEYNLTLSEFYQEDIKFYYDEDFDSTVEMTNVLSHSYETGSSENNDKVEGKNYYDTYKGENYFEYSYDFEKSNYVYSSFVDYCYNVFYLEEEKSTKIYTNNINSCFSVYDTLDEITISIFDYDNKVISSNADSVVNNTYIWIINKEEQYNSYIELYVDNDSNLVEPDSNTDLEPDSNYDIDSETADEDNIEIILLIVVLFFLMLGSIIIYRVKKSKVR